MVLLFASLVLFICFVSILCPIESERPCPELLYCFKFVAYVELASVCHNLFARLIFKPLGFVQLCISMHGDLSCVNPIIQ